MAGGTAVLFAVQREAPSAQAARPPVGWFFREPVGPGRVARGFKAVEFAAAMSDDGIVQEMAALREAVGVEILLSVDLHGAFTAGEAIRLIRRLVQHNLWSAEAPCAPEDLEGQAEVARSIGGPLALGEEWRTVFEYRPRFEARAMSIIQPEMGHKGITEFQSAASLRNVPRHEYQHSIFNKNMRYTAGDMACEAGFYTVPSGPGLGVAPRDAVLRHVIAEGRSHG
ncbi:MAG: enolase C-terminal domain-like protein [Alsobacter sp.]